jgi:hypothetical protein
MYDGLARDTCGRGMPRPYGCLLSNNYSDYIPGDTAADTISIDAPTVVPALE